MRRFVFTLWLAASLGVAWAQNAEPVASAERRLSLDEAIRLALEKNKAVKVDSFSRSIARANLLTAEGRFDPALTFRGSYSEDENPAGLGSLVSQVSRSDDYSLSLDGVTPWGLNYSLGGRANNSRGTFNGFADNYSSFAGVSVTQPLLRGFGFGANLNGIRVAKADRAISD